MKMKKLAIMALATALSVGSVMTASAAWIEEGSNWRYQNDNGTFQAGSWFRDADGRWYHFDNNGIMQRGWFQDTDGKWYFLAYNGVMQVGLIKVDNKVYFMNPSGDLFIGDKAINGTTYNFGLYGTTNGTPSVPMSATFGGNGNQSLSGGVSGGSSSSSSGGGGSTPTPTPDPTPEEKVDKVVDDVKNEVEGPKNETVTNVTVGEAKPDGDNSVVVAVAVEAKPVVDKEQLADVQDAMVTVVASAIEASDVADGTDVNVSVPGIKNNKTFKSEDLKDEDKLAQLFETYVTDVETYNKLAKQDVTVTVEIDGVKVTYAISLN